MTGAVVAKDVNYLTKEEIEKLNKVEMQDKEIWQVIN